VNEADHLVAKGDRHGQGRARTGRARLERAALVIVYGQHFAAENRRPLDRGQVAQHAPLAEAPLDHRLVRALPLVAVGQQDDAHGAGVCRAQGFLADDIEDTIQFQCAA